MAVRSAATSHPRRAYFPREVAAQIGYAEATVSRWLRERRLASIVVNGRRLVRAEDLDSLLRCGIGRARKAQGASARKPQ